MRCEDAREHLLDWQRGQGDPALRRDLEAHLEGCTSCRNSERLEAELSRVLANQLPRYRAPAVLRARVAERLASSAAAAAPPRRRTLVTALASAATAAAALLAVVRWTQPAFLVSPNRFALADELVNDHLRVVASSRPIEIESGGIHQVKPWFTGRLDFAPRVSFDGDAEFALKGGSVGYVGDRKAAVFVFGYRLHTLTLLVFPAEGLTWPSSGYQPLGRVQVHVRLLRGFTVYLWRDGGLGYGLVSDVNAADMGRLVGKIAGG